MTPPELPTLKEFPEHRRLLERAVSHFQTDRRVIGLAVGGSIAHGGVDFYSDVDLQIVVRDADFDAAFADRDAAAQAVGQPLFRFIADHIPGGDQLYIVLYQELVKLDFSYKRTSEMKPNWRLANRPILKDSKGFMADVQHQSQGLRSPTPAPETILVLHQKFWPWCWYVFGKIMRGELWEALDGVHWIRSMALLPMLDWVADRPHEGYRRLESKIDQQLSAQLTNTLVPQLKVEALYAALQAEIVLFCVLRAKVFARYGLSFDPEPEQVLRAAMNQHWIT